MKNILFLFFISSIVFSDINSILLKELYDTKTAWTKFDNNKDGKNIYVGVGTNKEISFIKIEQTVEYNKEDVFDVIKDLESYNNVINNKNILTSLVQIKTDTLYGYQLIANMIPFVRNRQYVFKMYMVNDSRLDWILLGQNNPLMKSYPKNNDMNTLVYGAGSWEMKGNNILSYRMYVDDKVKMPYRFIQKIRINSVVAIFNDILNHLKLDKDKINTPRLAVLPTNPVADSESGSSDEEVEQTPLYGLFDSDEDAEGTTQSGLCGNRLAFFDSLQSTAPETATDEKTHCLSDFSN